MLADFDVALACLFCISISLFCYMLLLACFEYSYLSNSQIDGCSCDLKLQREGQKAKKEKKKEKKREKREKGKTRGGGDIESKKHSHKKRRKDERSKEDQKGGELQKRTENEIEQIEKSSLTEERGHPVGSQASSDSTLNSNKRQKLSSPPNGRHNAGECFCPFPFPGQGCLLVGFV